MLCQTHPRVLRPRFHCHQARVRHIFLFFVFCLFFRLSFYVAHKVRLIWLLCSSEKSLCAVQVATELPSRQEVTRGDRLAPKPFAPGHQHNNPIPASPVSRNRMTMSFEDILDEVFWDVKFWRRAGNVSEEGRCSSETEQTLFVRTECSVCQESSHQQVAQIQFVDSYLFRGFN